MPSSTDDSGRARTFRRRTRFSCVSRYPLNRVCRIVVTSLVLDMYPAPSVCPRLPVQRLIGTSGQGCVISWGVITYQCYQLLSAAQLITNTDNSGASGCRSGGLLGGALLLGLGPFARLTAWGELQDHHPYKLGRAPSTDIKKTLDCVQRERMARVKKGSQFNLDEDDMEEEQLTHKVSFFFFITLRPRVGRYKRL